MKSETDKTAKSAGLQKLSITRLMSFFACFGFLVFAGIATANYTDSDCQQGDVVLQTAKNSTVNFDCSTQDNSVSWVTWITSKSASNQFHFLDLLELLSRSSVDDE